MKGRYKAGTLLVWKSDGKPAYEKLNDDDWGLWVCLYSNYLVEKKTIKDGKEVIEHELRPESDKPLYKKEGDLNRFGFQNTDEGTYLSKHRIMNFIEPK